MATIGDSNRHESQTHTGCFLLLCSAHNWEGAPIKPGRMNRIAWASPSRKVTGRRSVDQSACSSRQASQQHPGMMQFGSQRRSDVQKVLPRNSFLLCCVVRWAGQAQGSPKSIAQIPRASVARQRIDRVVVAK